MLEARQAFTIDAPLGEVWAYVGDIANWAASMPGYQSFEVLDERRSRWELKVALGALTRTVRLLVEIEEWRAPDRVAFTLRGESDPIAGSGTFDARAAGRATAVEFVLRISGSGPMAGPMEAMSRPVVPRMAQAIASSLIEAIEQPGRARHGQPASRRPFS